MPPPRGISDDVAWRLSVWRLSRTSGRRAACAAGRLDGAYWLIGPGSAGLAQGCHWALPLQAWAGAYRGGRPATTCFSCCSNYSGVGLHIYNHLSLCKTSIFVPSVRRHFVPSFATFRSGTLLVIWNPFSSFRCSFHYEGFSFYLSHSLSLTVWDGIPLPVKHHT